MQTNNKQTLIRLMHLIKYMDEARKVIKLDESKTDAEKGMEFMDLIQSDMIKIMALKDELKEQK